MPTYSYAEVETALAQLYDAKHVQRAAFRGRLKHIRKLKIPQEQPGKGARIRYGLEDIYQLLIALEFAEFGVDPHLIATIIRRHWRLKTGLHTLIAYAEQFPGDDFHVAFEPRFMSFTWNREWSRHTDTEITRGVTGEPIEIRYFKTSDSPTYWEALKEGRRFCVFNLSARIRAVKRALKSA
jgi:hypothetical protein